MSTLILHQFRPQDGVGAIVFAHSHKSLTLDLQSNDKDVEGPLSKSCHVQNTALLVVNLGTMWWCMAWLLTKYPVGTQRCCKESHGGITTYHQHPTPWLTWTANSIENPKVCQILTGIHIPVKCPITGSVADLANALGWMQKPSLLIPSILTISAAMQGATTNAELLQDAWIHILEKLMLPDLLNAGVHTGSFLTACQLTDSIMTGSCTRAMFTGAIDHPVGDLNLISSQEGFELMHAFLIDSLEFRQVSDNGHPAISHVIGQFRRYVKEQSTVTLSTPKPGMHLLHVILSAPSTADMLLMTGGGLACFYPQWSQAGIAVVAHTGRHISSVSKLGCAGDSMRVMRIEEDTGFLGRPCGKLCPTLWHHIDSSPHLLALQWAQGGSLKNIFKGADVEWRLRSNCMNSACVHSASATPPNFECAGSRSDADAKYVSAEIVSHRPTFHRIFQGVFYGSSSSRPHLVPVPVRHGFRGQVSLDDLDVNYWVKQYTLGVHVTARRRLRRTFDHVPHTPCGLDGLYTIFFERPASATPKNKLVRQMVRLNGSTDVIKGSVLVMKEGREGVKDMMCDDILRTNFLINRLVALCITDAFQERQDIEHGDERIMGYAKLEVCWS
ncbi:hypothetical protein C8R48DRAFT_668031 [Suillus tomentosus]|nr:hypothetical protein C8R48DRAFT_668031 [Suillus tomentosus]